MPHRAHLSCLIFQQLLLSTTSSFVFRALLFLLSFLPVHHRSGFLEPLFSSLAPSEQLPLVSSDFFLHLPLEPCLTSLADQSMALIFRSNASPPDNFTLVFQSPCQQFSKPQTILFISLPPHPSLYLFSPSLRWHWWSVTQNIGLSWHFLLPSPHLQLSP